jgi:UrcA family protein
MLNTLTALALLAAAPQAGVDPNTAMVRVSHADLDLSHAQGRRVLDRRIASAVEKVCPVANTAQLTTPADTLRCRSKANKAAALQRSAVIARVTAPLQLSAGSR